MRKTPQKKRVARSIKPRSNVDPGRMAIAALERIRTVLVKSGYEARLGQPLAMKELAAQALLLGTELPPSYVAAMRVASRIGEPDVFLQAADMPAAAERLVAEGGEEARRYAPFCRSGEIVLCFDTGSGKRTTAQRHPGELPIVEWQDATATPVAAHFGEWLDAVADAREEAIETAARLPDRLKRLLYELGFRFEYPVIGRLETGDAAAIEELLGHELASTVRADVDRLFDASGKASLTLNVDEFTLAVSLRTGIYVFEAEDVFRWLRSFRDENFFSDAVTVPSHPDQVRDLRRASREPPLVRRGVLEIAALPAKKLTSFRAASGVSADDFWLLARNDSRSERAPSLVLHVEGGVVTGSQRIDEPIDDLWVARDGTVWGLGAGHVVRVGADGARSFPLRAPGTGRPWWYGIGGSGERVLVWGKGALLEFDGHGFVPFTPDAGLDAPEAVVALESQGLRVWMLVCGDHVGAVARFDSVEWQPIDENQVLEGTLLHLDVWRSTAYVLDRDGGVWSIDGSHPPRALGLHTYHQAFLTESGARRSFHAVRAYDGGMLLAGDGGVLVLGSGEPLFHALPGGHDAFRIVRVGGRGRIDPGENAALVALAGPHAWIWRSGSFQVIDLGAW